MSIEACADLVRRGDPDRFLAVMAAPRAVRGRLFVLYAFNLEVARAPWVSAEPLIGRMRLAWWREVVANAASGAARAHEVAGPLHALIREASLPPEVLDRLVAARERDAEGAPFGDRAAFEGYLEDTAGGLMWLAVRACGGTQEAAARALGWAAGLAAYLAAVPALAARGRVPLVDDAPAALCALAGEGLARLDRAAGLRSPAALAGWMARPVLRRVRADPAAVDGGRLGFSEFARRGRLLWCALRGRV
jgi:phytoene/squalene synthetase